MRIPNQSPAVNQTVSVGDSLIKPSQAFSRVSLPSHADVFLLDREPSVVFATTDVKCGKTTYTISTGNNEGRCITTSKEGNTSGGGCFDSKGNSSYVDCGFNNGEGVCDSVNGSGSCSIKKVS